MKKYIKKIGKIVVLQIISFILLVGAITFAAIMLPNFTPGGGTAGGKFINFFEKLTGECSDGKVVGGIEANGTKICID